MPSTSAVDPGLKQRVERRFDVLPIQGGVVLKPKRTSAVRVIEIRDGAIDVDGVPASGALLREKLGADAELVLQVSYLRNRGADRLVHAACTSGTAGRYCAGADGAHS